MKNLKCLAAALLAASAAPVAHAQPAARTVAVHYGDLDLASPRGRAALDSRLRQAVRVACGEPSPADLRGSNRAGRCRDALTRDLTARRDAVYAAMSPEGPPVVLAIR